MTERPIEALELSPVLEHHVGIEELPQLRLAEELAELRMIDGERLRPARDWLDGGHDLVVVGPLRDGKLSEILRSLEPATALILCAPADSRELGQLAR